MGFHGLSLRNCGRAYSTVCLASDEYVTPTDAPLGFWMSDKPLVQQALASELAELVLTITTTSLSLTFLDMFWETIVREWNGIDRLRCASMLYALFVLTSLHRMDKYYMLVRRFVNASLRLLIRSNWEADAIERYNTILTREGGPLWSVSLT